MTDSTPMATFNWQGDTEIMKAIQFLAEQSCGGLADLFDDDPLAEDNRFLEAQLLGAEVDTLTSTVGLLFELRASTSLTEGNVGILIARRVQQFSWTAEARFTPKSAWNVVGSKPRNGNGWFAIDFDFFPDAQLHLVSESAEFLAGVVPGLSAGPPDYEADEEADIRSNLANWQSVFSPEYRSSYPHR